MLTEKSFDTGALTINYAEGPANGAPFVLLHGITQRWQELNPLVVELENNWHVFACDKRGHGKSGRAISYRAVDYFPDTKMFIEQQIGAPTILLGHSAGAIVALGVASAIPELVRAVILLDPVLYLRELSVRSNYLYAYLTGVNDILTHQRKAHEVFSEIFPNIENIEIQNINEMIHLLDQGVVLTWLEDRYFEDLKLKALLNKLIRPTLLLYGESDKGSFVRENDVEFFLAHSQNGHATQIKDAGHLLQWDQPGRVLELIAQFIDEI